MGAADFQTKARSENARAAFQAAREEAQHEHGHGGYTGSITEKESFKVVTPEDGETPQECLKRHWDQGTFDDKWGPAGCVELEEGVYIFFGYASC